MAARIVTVPVPIVFSVLPLIHAPVVPVLTTLHVIVLFVAFDGFAVPVSVSGVLAVAVVCTPVMLVTGTCDCDDEVMVILKSCV